MRRRCARGPPTLAIAWRRRPAAKVVRVLQDGRGADRARPELRAVTRVISIRLTPSSRGMAFAIRGSHSCVPAWPIGSMRLATWCCGSLPITVKPSPTPAPNRWRRQWRVLPVCPCRSSSPSTTRARSLLVRTRSGNVFTARRSGSIVPIPMRCPTPGAR